MALNGVIYIWGRGGKLHMTQYFLLPRSIPLVCNQINSSRVIFRGDNGAKILELPVTNIISGTSRPMFMQFCLAVVPCSGRRAGDRRCLHHYTTTTNLFYFFINLFLSSAELMIEYIVLRCMLKFSAFTKK